MLEAVLRDGEDMSVLLPYETIRAHNKRLAPMLDRILTPRLAVINVDSDANVMVERSTIKKPPKPSSQGSRSGSASSGQEETTPITHLRGLRDWSQGVFGDPLIASCFEAPSDDFLGGWRGAGEEIIEDEENKESRILLYKCYRAVLTIVIEYYRPQSDSSKREMDGRRKLTSALAELALNDEDDEASKRERSMSVDVGSTKRQKVGR